MVEQRRQLSGQHPVPASSLEAWGPTQCPHQQPAVRGACSTRTGQVAATAQPLCGSQLLNWHKRRAAAREPCRVQAVLPHSREDAHYLVLRPHGADACQALLDPRGAFVVELPDGMFVWQASSPAMVSHRCQSCRSSSTGLPWWIWRDAEWLPEGLCAEGPVPLSSVSCAWSEPSSGSLNRSQWLSAVVLGMQASEPTCMSSCCHVEEQPTAAAEHAACLMCI